MTSTSSEALRRRTVSWVVGLATFALVVDGYDLQVYGTVVPLLLRDPGEIGEVTPALAGVLGSCALIGVLVGAMLAGSVGDIVGRRKVLLTAYAWFSLGMALTALTTTAAAFGLLRFVTGIGIGAILATAGAQVAEFAPPGRKNLLNAITYAGAPLGGMLVALLAILLLGSVGWRGMFLLGAIPLVTLFPLAVWKMPESPAWLAARGRLDEARAVSLRTGVPLEEATVPTSVGTPARAGFAGLFDRTYRLPTVVLGVLSVTALVLVYLLLTWLPELMNRAGLSTSGSLAFLLVFNGGAVLGAMGTSWFADRLGPKTVVAASFLLGAVAMALLTLDLPLGVKLVLVAVVGQGATGTSILIYGLVATYYRTNVRSAGVAWCAGFGRLGGIGGPVVGGLLVAAGLALNSIFYILVAIAVFGALLTLVVPSAAARATKSAAAADAPQVGAR